ncbi:hypothetical protein BC739_004038 [Kutzneria viridogrisea]|uniref:Uncharacterized protein n=1 Tax=Kutzneria viridogrisea TaxID=47990 RepID=A0ABR6BIW4_9PSEU|nr:hypothetical protein [Kutzneria viridogrisea]
MKPSTANFVEACSPEPGELTKPPAEEMVMMVPQRSTTLHDSA